MQKLLFLLLIYLLLSCKKEVKPEITCNLNTVIWYNGYPKDTVNQVLTFKTKKSTSAMANEYTRTDFSKDLITRYERKAKCY